MTVVDLLRHCHSIRNLSRAWTLFHWRKSVMNYYMAAILPISFGEALERTEETLKQEGLASSAGLTSKKP